MEKHFYNDDFEELIKQKADQYKMYPSEKVWKGVYRALHFPRRWYWVGFVLLLSGISFYSLNELLTPSTATSIIDKPELKKPDNKLNVTDILQITPVESSISKNNLSPQFKTVAEGLTPDLVFIETAVEEGKQEIYYKESITESWKTTDELGVPRNDGLLQLFSFMSPVTKNDFPQKIETKHPKVSPVSNEPISEESSEDIKKINWLQEYAMYELIAPKIKRISWQLSFSPTINYRKLTGSRNANIQSTVKNIPIALNIQGDVEKLVNHKPALGFELGSFIQYAVNKNLILKGGAQFNYSRYDIKAYGSNASERATIALTSVTGLTSDSIIIYTRLRNFGGNEVEDLQNQYFQVSAPIGVEYRLLGNKRLQLSIAGTIQPTYLINRNSYLITTDYRNYTKEPSLVRRWNVNSSAEAFISYKTAGIKWQVGPQFRYQLLSSYDKEYPIKEYLMEYGIKIGVSKTIR